MSHYVVISALGEDRSGIVKGLSKRILDCGGNIAESRMAVLGGEFTIVMLVQGVESAADAIEQHSQKWGDELGLVIHTKRTRPRTVDAASLNYQVEVVSMDHPGIVHDITDFLSSRDINIQELETHSYAAAHTGTPMFAVNIQISVPAVLSVGKFKREFLDFCDSLNLDGQIEAQR
ncbi:MAG: glycine cleavage system protein R [Gammaproteobacteria bacterium]|nr:glycine cleavage system protein R [Gammaproteobacteria bacterium]